MGDRLNAKAKAELAKKGFLVEDLPSAPGPEKGVYHNPQTGQEFPRLPIDGYSQRQYRSRGLKLGRAPEHLRLKYQREHSRPTSVMTAEEAAKASGAAETAPPSTTKKSDATQLRLL